MYGNDQLTNGLRKQQEEDARTNSNSRTSYVNVNDPPRYEDSCCDCCCNTTRKYAPLTTSQMVDATVLHVLLGWVGALHFYLGRPKMGIVYFFTFGLLGVGYLYDFFRLPTLFADYNRRQLRGPNSLPSKPYDLGEAYVCWLTFGLFGGHHFYLGDIGRGFLYLFTLGGIGVLYVLDLFMLPQLTKEANDKAIAKAQIKIQNRNYQQGVVTNILSASATNQNPERIAIPIDQATYAIVEAPIVQSSGSSSAIREISPSDVLVVKSTTIYTPSDQIYTTDAQTTAIGSDGAANIPYAYTVKSDNRQNP